MRALDPEVNDAVWQAICPLIPVRIDTTHLVSTADGSPIASPSR